MSLDDYFRIGETITLGTHLFEAEAIKAFARKYDPQIFHLDEEAAARSVLGGLCASGWHTAAVWMKYNLLELSQGNGPAWPGPGPAPEFGPSPGFTDMKWLRPVHAGETVTYTRRTLGHRAMASRPGWRILTMTGAGALATGEPVISFDSAVLVKVAGSE